MFNHSKMILDPLVSDVGYDKEKPEMDDGRSSLRWWIFQRMTLKGTVSPLTSSLSGGCRQIGASRAIKSVRGGAAWPCFHRYQFRVRQDVQPWTVVRLIFPRWWPSPRVPTRRNSFDNRRRRRNRNSQALPSKSRWECFLLRIRFEEWENVMYRMVDTMTMPTLCRARICVCGGGIYEKELWFCDSRCYTSIAVSCFALCASFRFFRLYNQMLKRFCVSLNEGVKWLILDIRKYKWSLK